MTRSVLGVVLALFAVAGCAQQIPGAASPDPVVMQEIAACDTATDRAVTAGLAWLSDIEINGDAAAGPDTEPFYNLPQACRHDPSGAWSEFVVRTHDTFEPLTIQGQFAQRQFLIEACTRNNTSPFMELTVEAQAVCAGG